MSRAKCVVVGDSGVGKSCLLVCYTKNVFPVYTRPSFSDTIVKITVDGKTTRLHLWDTAPQEEYDSLRILCYHNTNVWILCFSIDNCASFENVKYKWYPEVNHHCPNAPILVVGTKIDVRDNEERLNKLKEKNFAPYNTEQGINLAEAIHAVKYMECSALNQEGVKEVFQEAARAVLNHVPVKSKKGCRLL